MKRIGIYSGHIPSTTFVEHLIRGLAKTGNYNIEVYGVVRKTMNYPDRVCIKPIPASYLMRIFFVGWHFLFLLLNRTRSAVQIARYFSRSYKDFHTLMHDASLALVISRNPPDIFHIQWAKSIISLSWLVELEVCKTVLSLRGSHINYTPVLEPDIAIAYKRLFPKVDGFHAVSAAIAQRAFQYGAPPGKTEVVYSIVPDSIMAKYGSGLPNNKLLRILSIGRFHWIKGYGYAIDAMAILKARNVTFQYTLIAPDASEDILFQIQDQQLDTEVEIINGLPHQEVLERMLHYDLLLLSSLEEGIANVVLEAMAVGLPVISTNCGGMGEVVTHKENGWMVPVRNSQAIAEAIEDFINTSAGEKNSIRKKAYETVLALCNEKNQLEKFSRLYQRVIDAKD